MRTGIIEIARLTAVFIAANAAVLLRMVWLPALLLALCGVFFASGIVPNLPALQSGDAQQLERALLLSWKFIALGVLVPIVMSATAGTAIMRFAVFGEDEGRGTLVPLIGAPTLRVMGVNLLLGTHVLFFAVLMGIALKSLGGLVPALIAYGTPVATVALLLLISRWLMAYPMAAVRGRIDIAGAWAFTRPIYGRFLVLVVALGIAVFLVDLVLDGLFVPGGAQTLKALSPVFRQNWPLIALGSFLSNIFVMTAFFSLIAIVYRLRTQELEQNVVKPIRRPVTDSSGQNP